MRRGFANRLANRMLAAGILAIWVWGLGGAVVEAFGEGTVGGIFVGLYAMAALIMAIFCYGSLVVTGEDPPSAS